MPKLHDTFIPSNQFMQNEMHLAIKIVIEGVAPLQARAAKVAERDPDAADATAEVHLGVLLGVGRHLASRLASNPALVEKVAADTVIYLINKDVEVAESALIQVAKRMPNQ